MSSATDPWATRSAVTTTALVALFLSACQRADADLPPLGGLSIELGLRTAAGATLVDGNQLDLVENGAVFDAIEREIKRARKSVNILVFIWRGEDGPSEQVGRALLARAKGVTCRIVIDPHGSMKFSKSLKEKLERTGCSIRRYISGDLFQAPVLARNHRKIVVVDGERAITGGFGIWRSWEGDGNRRDNWRDTAIRVAGPAVAGMQKAFEQSWREAGGEPLPATEYPQPRRAGRAKAAFVASSPSRERASAAEAMTHLLIRNASRRLWIANSYFVPDEKLQKLLIERKKAGVDIRVLAPGAVHDLPPIRAAQQATYEPLIAAGIRIFEYQPSMMHAKTMLVDDRWVVVGSINFDQLSFDFLEEGSIVADSRWLARTLRRHLEDDFERAVEIHADNVKRVLLPKVARDSMEFVSDWL